ncbi:phosphonate C-P lyase system protein PhnG [Pelagibius sp. 7325]|uniref:phosphonate C-P lyase system protein PhnG n=1 Tax=Pelagibius sp. 7325 TaxID=3131994 RepID=UPI0030EC6FBD
MDTASNFAAEPAAAEVSRRRWMSVLAKAETAELESAWDDLPEKPAYGWLRQPEIGMVMVRARAGGTGGRFNLGQMTVTRCALRLLESGADGDTEVGIVGLGYVQGRSKRHAELAAVFDALLQDEARRGMLEGRVIAPLEAAHAERRDARSRKANSTKVNFFTLVRGENDK